MASTNLGACEWFVWDIRRSHLINNETLDQAVAAFLTGQPQGEPPALAQHLVEQKLLTPFQAERLLQGKSHDLVLGPYVLLETVGSGSMGAVYRAVSTKDHKPYAVKVLPRRSTWNARMARRQVTTFEKCKHAAVVPFVDVGTAGAMHYLAWPFVEGESLQTVVQRESKLIPERAAQLALQAAEGLHLCHQNGLIHGMIKPSNLMIGKDEKIRILDFGVGALLAQGEEESLVDTRSTANVLASGLDCVSPESILDPTQRTAAGDQYSLGCVLYYCLAGRLPFEGTAAEKIEAHRTKQPDPIRDQNPDVSEALAAVVDRLMQKEPSARYGDMSQVVAALRPIADPTAAAPVPTEAPAELSVVPVELSPADSGAASQSPSTIDTPVPRKHAIPTPPELSATPFVPAAIAFAAKANEREAILVPTQALPALTDADIEAKRKQSAATPPAPLPPAPLPPGATKVLGRAPARKASDFSVFDLPAVNDPWAPKIMPSPAKTEPVASPSGAEVQKPGLPKLQPPSSPEKPIPVREEVIAQSPSRPVQQTSGPALSLEERLGSRTMMFLAMFAALVVFILGYLLFSLIS